jgi:hypothetical protein
VSLKTRLRKLEAGRAGSPFCMCDGEEQYTCVMPPELVPPWKRSDDWPSVIGAPDRPENEVCRRCDKPRYAKVVRVEFVDALPNGGAE